MPKSRGLILTAGLAASALGAVLLRPVGSPAADSGSIGEDGVALHVPRDIAVSANGEAEAEIRLTVDEAYHLQANPASHAYLIPTVVEIEPRDGVEVGPPTYPRGEPYVLEGSADTLSVYGGDIAVTVPIRAGAEAVSGAYTLRGALTYQRCDHRSCFRPVTIPLALTVRLTGS